VDADAGLLLVSVGSGSGADWVAGEWKTAFAEGVQPSAAVGGWLFPVMSGNGGARVSCNFGLNSSINALRISPPTPEYRPLGTLVVWHHMLILYTRGTRMRLWTSLGPESITDPIRTVCRFQQYYRMSDFSLLHNTSKESKTNVN
jgi:hypothetical protein